MKAVVFCFFALQVMFCQGTAYAEDADIQLARNLIFFNADVTAESELFVKNTLESLEECRLYVIKEIINIDINAESGSLVGQTSMDRQLARQLVNAIDWRLGILDYDEIIDSREVNMQVAGHLISYASPGSERYNYISVDTTTLLPEYGYNGKNEKPIRVYVKRRQGFSNSSLALKIEYI